MTGGGFGPCGGGLGRRSAGAGYGARGGGFGRGPGYGRGQGFRNRRWAPEWSGWRRVGAAAPLPPDVEKEGLQREEQALEAEIARLRERISELESSG